MKNLTIKISPSLHLKPISLVYLQDIFENFTLEVVEFLPLLKPSADIENTKSYIIGAMESNEKGTDFHWVILKDDAFIGCCGMREANTKIGDFGFWIKSEAQGLGYGKLIANAVFEWSFENCGIQKIKYPVDKRNTSSVKIIEGLGGKLVKSYRDGQLDCLDIHEYHVDKNNW